MTEPRGGRRARCIFAGLMAVAGVILGCGSTKSGGSGGQGGHAGSLASQTSEGGALGSGGVSSNPGTTGLGSGGTVASDAGKSGSGGMSLGGTTGQASGGIGAAGGGPGGGATAVDAGAADAGCVGTACSRDAGLTVDLPPACGLLRTQAACDLRSDCHSVSIDDQLACDCATPGCCMRFQRCEYGGTAACAGRVNCTQVTPPCGASYAVQYQDDCYNGCVLASKCAPTATCPTTAPSNGASCGGTSLSCVYQDCTGTGRTQAICQGGTWDVQTATCDSLACKGGGTSSREAVICGPGQICVHTTSGGGAYMIKPSCATNNCGSSPLALSCVQGLSGSCLVTADATIDCSLQTCTGSSSCPP